MRVRFASESQVWIPLLYVLGSAASFILLWQAHLGALKWDETLGFITGVWCVVLVARNSIWNFPVGLANNLFLGFVFVRSGLYNDTSLQIVYFVLGVQGWYLWSRGGQEATQLPITRAYQRQLWGCVVAIIVVTPVLMLFATWLRSFKTPLDLSTIFAVTLPTLKAIFLQNRLTIFLDAFTTAISLAAQWLLNNKKIENWWFWIFVDVIYIPLYILRDLWLTAALYACFLLICVAGLAGWQRSLATDDVHLIPIEPL